MGSSRSNQEKPTTRVEPTVCQLLVHGYVRTEIACLLPQQIVPDSVVNVVWMFFNFNLRKWIFCLRKPRARDENTEPLYFTQVGCQGRAWKASFSTQSWSINDTLGVCATTGLQRYPKTFLKYHHVAGSVVLFVAGHGHSAVNYGNDDKCFCAIFVDTNALATQAQSANINAHRWDLPHHSLNKIHSHTLAFSKRHQMLFSVGGEYLSYGPRGSQSRQRMQLFCLDFKDDIENMAAWKWRRINAGASARYNPASVVIDKHDKLFIVGGKAHAPENVTALGNDDDAKSADAVTRTSMLIYDIKQGVFSKGADCTVDKCGFHCSGIVNNQYNTGVIYVGGGTDSAHLVRQYDANKNEWSALPNTGLKYGKNPVLWLENEQELYIASNRDHCCERLDLRQAKEWSIVQGEGTLFADLHASAASSSRTRLVVPY